MKHKNVFVISGLSPPALADSIQAYEVPDDMHIWSDELNQHHAMLIYYEKPQSQSKAFKKAMKIFGQMFEEFE